MGVYEEVTSEGGRRAEVEAALAAVSATPEFVRAPVMRRLLDYLVQETLAGRGDQVKAYSVAVDGLGRDPDFDTQADSYPRVQVGRLRRMIDAHYARHPLKAGVGLSVPNGSYKVRFFSPGEPAAAAAAPITLQEREWQPVRRVWPWIAAVLALTALLAAAMIWILVDPLKSVAPGGLVPSPVLEVQRVSTDGSAEATRLGGRVDMVFGGALYRSFVQLVQSDAKGADAKRGDARDGDVAHADYRLISRVTSSDGAATLFVQIHHIASGRQIWSETVPLPSDDAQLEPAMRPMITRLIQPFGIIATDQRARFTDPAAPGFPCLLLFQDYRRTHDQAIRATVNACLERTSQLDPTRSNILSAQSFMAYDASGLDPANAAALRRQGATLARAAIRADPFSGAGHLALASAFYFEGRCDLGKASAMRSMEMNPYSADKMATLGAFMFQCHDPDAEHYLRESIALDPNGPAYARTPLIILLIARGERAEALALANAIVPPMDATRPYYDVTMALALAANGKRAAAAAAWQRVIAATRGRPDQLDAVIGSHVPSPGLRRATLDALIAAGLVKPRDLPAR